MKNTIEFHFHNETLSLHFKTEEQALERKHQFDLLASTGNRIVVIEDSDGTDITVLINSVNYVIVTEG